MANPFIKNPIRIIVYDPIENKTRRAFVSLGNAPKNVVTSCKFYNSATSEMKKKYKSQLCEFYGKDYQSKLGLEVNDYSSAWLPMGKTINGGYQNKYSADCLNSYADPRPILVNTADIVVSPRYESTPGDGNAIGIPICAKINDELTLLSGQLPKTDQTLVRLVETRHLTNCTNFEGRPTSEKIGAGDYEDIEELLADNSAATTNVEKVAKMVTFTTSTSDLRVDFHPGIEYDSTTHIYPEDNFINIKEKIFIMTGIPVYRQHVFYNNNDYIRTTYNLYADGVYSTSMTELNTVSDNIFGIPVDKTLYMLRNEIKVDALDTFFTAGMSLTDNTIYVVDIAQFTRQVSSRLPELLKDTYQTDIFYYGFVIKYWPMITKEIFVDFITDEGDLQNKYPELSKNKSALQNIYKIESEIIDYKYCTLERAAAYAASHVGIAIINITASVNTIRTEVNIRNLFDLLKTAANFPEIRAYVTHNNKKLMLRKRYSGISTEIVFPNIQTMKIGLVAAVSVGENKWVFLNIWPSGRYFVKTSWNEEDNMTFTGITAIIKKYIKPIIDGINEMGQNILVAGSKLPEMSKHNINFQSMTISLFWKRVLNNSAYKLVREHIDEYIRGGLMSPRVSNQYDKQEFIFRKGIHQYDTRQVDKIISASGKSNLTNQYTYLVTTAVLQKWNQHYDGRIIRISHRTTDVMFEVSDIRESEFNIFQEYINCIVYKLSQSEKLKQLDQEKNRGGSTKKLKKLREQDPELYNLKKHGSTQVYSRLCQNQHQPTIYTKEEMKNMSANELKKLTPYWNFTLNRPTYYGCPNSKYPYISFITGAHPKKYCLPCCHSKLPHGEDNKRAVINSKCMKNYVYDEHIQPSEISRHIMGYGKLIEPGRLAKPTPMISKNLLAETRQHPGDYYLIGVLQKLPGESDVGLVFAIAEVLGLSIEKMVTQIIAGIRQSPWLFNTLSGGTLGSHFSDFADFLASMKEIFVDGKFHVYAGYAFSDWNNVIMALVDTVFGVSTLMFLDTRVDNTNVDLFIKNVVKYEILTNTPKKYAVVAKIGEVYFPMMLLVPDEYYKYGSVINRTFEHDSPFLGIIRNILKFEMGEANDVGRTIDLEFVKDFSAANKYHIVHKHINNHNACYAVSISARGGSTELPDDLITIPIEFCDNISDGVPVTFDPPHSAAISGAMSIISEMNGYIEKKYSISETLTKYALIRPVEYLCANSGEVMGINVGWAIMYAKASTAPTDLPKKNVLYDYNSVNTAILSHQPPANDGREDSLGEALYKNYSYQLFLIEFIAYINTERNKEIRGKISSLIESSNIKTGIAVFRAGLKKILDKFAADYVSILDVIYQIQQAGGDKRAIIEQIEMSQYDFDRSLLNSLKNMQPAEVRARLLEITNQITMQKQMDTAGIKFPNVYGPCSTTSYEYCAGKKLIINRPAEEYVDILMGDLRNELKMKYLVNNFSTDNILDYLSFIQRSGEIISIYELSH